MFWPRYRDCLTTWEHSQYFNTQHVKMYTLPQAYHQTVLYYSSCLLLKLKLWNSPTSPVLHQHGEYGVRKDRDGQPYWNSVLHSDIPDKRSAVQFTTFVSSTTLLLSKLGRKAWFCQIAHLLEYKLTVTICVEKATDRPSVSQSSKGCFASRSNNHQIQLRFGLAICYPSDKWVCILHTCMSS